MAIHEMEVLDVTGHTTRKWDEANETEMKTVQRIFDDLTRKGYRAFTVNKDAVTNETLSEPRHSFDPEAEKLLLIPAIQAG